MASNLCNCGNEKKLLGYEASEMSKKVKMDVMTMHGALGLKYLALMFYNCFVCFSEFNVVTKMVPN